MLNYVLRRIAQALLVMLLLSFVCYALMALMPGDPVDMMAASNPHITHEDVLRLKAIYGLDQPLYSRYGHWLADTLSGDLGYSRTYHVPVMSLLGDRLLNTFMLSMAALILALVVAIPVGVMTALKKGTVWDYGATLLAFAGQSVPQFWLGIVAIMVFSVYLGWFPAGGTETIGADFTGFAWLKDRLTYAFLPIMVFTIAQMAAYLRFTRASMIEALHMDFVRTARAKGLSRHRVIWNHAFRNALLPLITVVALGLSGVFSGAIITEQVFSYQGVGKLVYDAIIANDFNVAMVSFNITVGMVVIMNLIADVAYAVADPRVSF